MKRSPFGLRNTIPSDDRGWIFLERFTTMVRCAMLPPEAFDSVVFSNSKAVRPGPACARGLEGLLGILDRRMQGVRTNSVERRPAPPTPTP